MLFSIYAISIEMITIAELAFLSIISLKSIPILNQIYFTFSEYRNNKNSVLLLEEEYKKFNIKYKLQHDSNQYLIELSDVNINYEITNVTLPDLKINLHGGYLIIGPSGSGKSTLIKLILGQHLVHDGEIIYNKNYSNLKFSFCDQESVLFNESLLFNITFKNSIEQVNIKRLKEVFNICNLGDILGDFQKITEFKIEEMGKSLSGGQIQRVNIARAIYKDSDVYILDEITSSLDTKLQLDIYKSLILFLKDKLVIHIAHRNEIINLFNEDHIISL
jgi:ABC-type bacteriocin/lantibiotic exporter with double-glycine peptidase domain